MSSNFDEMFFKQSFHLLWSLLSFVVYWASVIMFTRWLIDWVILSDILSTDILMLETILTNYRLTIIQLLNAYIFIFMLMVLLISSFMLWRYLHIWLYTRFGLLNIINEYFFDFLFNWTNYLYAVALRINTNLDNGVPIRNEYFDDNDDDDDDNDDDDDDDILIPNRDLINNPQILNRANHRNFRNNNAQILHHVNLPNLNNNPQILRVDPINNPHAIPNGRPYRFGD